LDWQRYDIHIYSFGLRWHYLSYWIQECNNIRKLVDSTTIIAWSFSNSSFSIGDALATKNLDLFVHHRRWFFKAWFLAVDVSIILCVLIIGCGFVAFFIPRRRETLEEVDDWNWSISLIGLISIIFMQQHGFF